MIRFGASCLTLDLYPSQWNHVYTDGSVWVDEGRAAYGVLIRYPDGSASEICGTCREPQAEAHQTETSAIVTSLNLINTFVLAFPQRKRSVVIFTDCRKPLYYNSIEKYPHTI